jgi:hypothetical protein
VTTAATKTVVGNTGPGMKARRLDAGLGRNAVAARATMGARTLSLIEDGQMLVTDHVLARIALAIHSLIREELREAR